MSNIQALQRGDEACSEKRYAEAIEAYLEVVRSTEIPDADACLKLARCHVRQGQGEEACAWLKRVVDSSDQFLPWQAASSVLRKLPASERGQARRNARIAVLGSYTTSQFVGMLQLAALRRGIEIETYEAGYAQYRQEILDPSSGLYGFEPDFVVMAMHAGETSMPGTSDSPEDAVEAELGRWRSLWEVLDSRSNARVIMHNFALPLEAPLGNLTAKLPGARGTMLTRLNARLGEAAGDGVSIVDCERLSAAYGKRRWFDDKYWHAAKQAVSLDALPLLAKNTAAVLAAELGLGGKCLVLDLDNTLWGGVIGEDGLSGIRLGAGPDGEAFSAFQQYILELRKRGVILAVCSKNNDADAREPFEKHPDMRLKLEDIAMFVANWNPKSENLGLIAESLNIGLDSLVFVDDNPAEREVIRSMLPEVEVVTLPSDPSGYVRALDDSLFFETSSFTAEDGKKTEQYRARARIAELESTSTSLDEFYESLQMKAVIAPFDEMHLPRIVQLMGKTNQFNLTTRRHGMGRVRKFMADENCVPLYLKLRDRFTDHGLVGVVIAAMDGSTLDIDTWFMSCRVIGRTAEQAMFARICEDATKLGCEAIRGTYIPSAKNAMVKDHYEKLGFERADEAVDAEDERTIWRYDLASEGAIENPFIEIETQGEDFEHDSACAA